MRATNHPSRPRRRLAGAAVTATAAAVALSLLPGGVAAAEETTERVSVRVKVATKPQVRVTGERNVWPATLLARHGFVVDADDKVKVRRDGRRVKGRKRKVREGDLVRLVRIEKWIQRKRVKIKPRTVTVSTTRLRPGRRKVVSRGKPGVSRVKARRTARNGNPVKYKVLSRKTIRPAKPRRVLVGRKKLSVSGADGLNWRALANCESSGNPRAVNPAGYYGLYQFNVGTWRSVGGSGMPHHASAAQQTYRAKLLYKSRGRQPWPHCGRLL